jgi:hypothetical protein
VNIIVYLNRNYFYLLLVSYLNTSSVSRIAKGLGSETVVGILCCLVIKGIKSLKINEIPCRLVFEY